MKNINILVNGSKGRMGIETLKAIEDDPELALVGQTDLGDDLESVSYTHLRAHET